MILLFSDNWDHSTRDVLKYLEHFGEKWLLIADDNDLTVNILFEKNDTKMSVCVGEKVVDIQEITAYWYRRGNGIYVLPPKFTQFELQQQGINTYLYAESTMLRGFAQALVEKCEKGIGSFFTVHTNKLFNLHTAVLCGLQIPQTLVTSAKKEVITFLKTATRIITKGIEAASVETATDKKVGLGLYSTLVDAKMAKKMPNTFFPSLFQAYQEKKYELRIFYLHGKFYSMAIFSQLDEQTKTDFRNYNYKKPNRNVPFKLPSEIEQKLDALMRKLNLNTGSIDMILTPKNEYVFLEVNPIGQFGMVSYPCNYFLEKKIATFLSTKTS